MQQKQRSTSAVNIFSAWQEGIAKAAGNPIHKQQLLQKEPELLPRFAAHYEKLKALPRRMRRTLQRKWKQGLAGVALLMMLGQIPAHAATINVGGACTLVKAITAANNDATSGGSCVKGSGADTVVLPSGSTQTLTAVNNAVYRDTGLPVIRGVSGGEGRNRYKIVLSELVSPSATPSVIVRIRMMIMCSRALSLHEPCYGRGAAD